MRIVKLDELLAMPGQVLFSTFDPMVMENLQIKVEGKGALELKDDFWLTNIVDGLDVTDENLYKALGDSSVSLKRDFDLPSRWGMGNKDAQFAVYEPQDVIALINRLKEVLYSQGLNAEEVTKPFIMP